VESEIQEVESLTSSVESDSKEEFVYNLSASANWYTIYGFSAISSIFSLQVVVMYRVEIGKVGLPTLFLSYHSHAKL
jgi:hypothetical protein